MNKVYRPHSWYIKLIHIAKNQLDMADDVYRQTLIDLTTKDSCKNMTIPELNVVLTHFKKAGFKVKTVKVKSPKTSNKPAHNMLDKLRQVWIQMHYQGLLSNGSEQALQTWASNQSKRLNKGVPVKKLEWLTGKMEYALIEQLKKWHLRLLEKAMPGVVMQLIELQTSGVLSDSEQRLILQLEQHVNQAPNSHEVVSSAYSDFLAILKQHNVVVHK